MNRTKTDLSASHDTLQLALKLVDQAQSIDRSHLVVAALFIFVLNERTTFTPISIPAFILAGYHEWSLYNNDGISTIKYTLSVILIC